MSADTLSYCTPGMPGYDSLVRDQAFREFSTRSNGTQCQTILRIAEAGKPTIPFIPSGGSVSSGAVAWSTGGADAAFKRLALIVGGAGDVKDMPTEFGDIFGLQRRFLWELFKQEMSRQLWAVAPVSNSPRGMVHFASQNPLGVFDLSGAPLTAADMGALREMVAPWSASSPMAFVMHSKTLRVLEDAADSRVQYHLDDRSGIVSPYWGSFRIILCDFIELAETDFPGTSVYFVRFGSGPDDPFGLRSVALVYPEGRVGLQASPLEPRDGTGDVWVSTLHVDYFWDQGQVARMAGIGHV